jgi:hypothetical protein
MRFIEDLCPPALLYLIFLVVQLGLDASLGLWVTMVVKAFLGLATVGVLDVFCDIDLGVVSWFLVAAPFIITAVATSIAMGTNFDHTVLLQLKETFVDSRMRGADDLPLSSGDPSIVSNPSGSAQKESSQETSKTQ